MAAFWDLSSCRPLGMAGVGPIAWTAAREYAGHKGYGPDEFDEFWHHIKELDAAFLAHQGQRAARERPSGDQHRGPAPKPDKRRL